MTEQEKPLLPPDSNPRQWPEVMSRRCHSTDGQWHASIQFYIPRGLAWLDGHFPQQPVLPGVVQVHWAATLCQFLFDLSLPFRSVENLKFQTMILPDTSVILDLTCVNNASRVQFKYYNQDTLFSEGKLRFGE